ncbi:MAG: tetratricopeptide repeat protein [Bryobacteraceae bacterium]
MRTGQLVLLALAGVGALVAQSAARAASDIESRLNAAREAERAHDYARAGAEYEQILRLHPDMAVIHQNLGLTYHLRNRFADAGREFARAIQLDGSLWGAHLFLGIDDYKTNRFDKAIASLQKSITLNSQAEPEARFWLGASFSAAGRPADAVREYRRTAELRPNDIEVSYALAKEYDAEATRVFDQIRRVAPRAGAVSLLRAERFLADNRADLASIEYRNALLVRPDYRGDIPALDAGTTSASTGDAPVSAPDARATLEQAAYWAEHGDVSRARNLVGGLTGMKAADSDATRYIEAAREAVSKGQLPSDSGSWPGLYQAWQQAQTGSFPVAEKTLRNVIAADPGAVDAFLALGKIYKMWAEALLDRMIQLNPDSYRVHQLQGEQHEEKTEYDQALRSYQAALEREPALGGIRYAIGNVYWKMHEFGPAEKWLKDELARNPNHGLAHYRLGSIYTESGKPDDAIPHLREALASHPELTGAHFDLGRALVLKGQYADAVTELQKVATEEPANDRVHYILSNAYRKMGQDAMAQTEMELYQTLTRERLERAQKDVRDTSKSLEKKP